MSKISEFNDAFKKQRTEIGTYSINDQGEEVTMILGLSDLRKAAFDYKTFSSEVEPGRIVVPSEVKIRDIRQIPFEVDPPAHKAYRALVEPWFRRPAHEQYQLNIRNIVEGVFKDISQKKELDLISEFALVLQSKALTVLLQTPLKEAETWISWGTHVFRSEGEALDNSKANVLYNYLDQKIAEAISKPTEDIYNLLLNAEYEGRKLTKEEIKGVLILTFAGGRDTVINAVTNTLVYMAENPKAWNHLKENPAIIPKAVEEFIRYFSPLTHIGRVVTQETQVCEHAAKANSRMSLCWHSANRDESVFENPNEVILDRQKNPHVGFGFSHHNCLGAHHARLVLKTLLEVLLEKVDKITLGDYLENLEEWGGVQRKVGFHKVNATFKFN